MFQLILDNIGLILTLVTTAITVVVANQISMKNVQKDVAQIKIDVSAQRDKDSEHDIKFAQMQGEIDILAVEQKNLREYAINGINELKSAIDKLRELLMSR